jgi:hypothetical protein
LETNISVLMNESDRLIAGLHRRVADAKSDLQGPLRWDNFQNEWCPGSPSRLGSKPPD